MTGWPQPDEPSGSITLVLDQRSTLGPKDDLRDGLSAITRQGSHLWIANDETTSLERLTLEAGGRAGAHQSFDLSNLLELPGEGEIDIEGLDVGDDALWLIGSHSSARKRAKKKHTPEEVREALATVAVSPRRRLLARLSTAALLDPGNPTARQRPAVFGAGQDHGGLLDLLADDPHLGGFIRSSVGATSRPIPGKDNGIDCEGLAVRDDRVFIGLRGPVLRGWAVVVELEVGDAPGLEPQPIGPGGRRYRKHFLNLRGLGIRDLCRDGDDLLVLAGPTMELDGRTAVFRWRGALVSQGEAVLHKGELKCELNVPFGKGGDRAEGITLLEDGRSAVVVYDSPDAGRMTGSHGIRADVFALRRPGTGKES